MSKKLKIVCIVLAVLLIIVIGVGVYTVSTGFFNPLERHVKKAVQHMNNGEYEEAILEFDKAIAIEDKIPEIYLAKANAQIMAGDKEGAKKTTSIAIELRISGEGKESDVVVHLVVILEGENNFMSEEDVLRWWYEATEGMDEYEDLRKYVAEEILDIEHKTKEELEKENEVDIEESEEEEEEETVVREEIPPLSPDATEEEKEEWRKAFDEYLSMHDNGSNIKYMDLNGDGIPEMYIEEGSGDADVICVYDPRTGTIKEDYTYSDDIQYNEETNGFKTSAGQGDYYFEEDFYIDEDYNINRKDSEDNYTYEEDSSYSAETEENGREYTAEVYPEYNDVTGE